MKPADISLNRIIIFLLIVIITATVTLFTTVLNNSNIAKISLLNPVAINAKIDRFQEILVKLEQYRNSYSLYRKPDFPLQLISDNDLSQLKSYIVTDYNSGNILAAKSESERIPIASLTKIMTAVVALDLAGKKDIFTATDRLTGMEPTVIGITPGEKLTLEELLHATLMTSANDAVEMIRDEIDRIYGYGTFIKAMNTKAAIIGLKDTHFDNPQGFDGDNYSTGRDMAVLTHYALENYPDIAAIVKKDYVFIPQTALHKQYDLYNWNGLLGVYPNVLGVKIGNTDSAGKTSIVVSERNGKKVLAVVLNASTILERDLSGGKLLDFGFQKLGINEFANITERQLQAKYATWKFWN